MINWTVVCSPKENGGMGVTDLNIQNIPLLLRWWWRPYAVPEALWSTTVVKLRRTGHYINGPSFWAVQGSFFWNQLHKLKFLFHWSTEWTIGSGARISFWKDAWNGRPLELQLVGRPPQPYLSLRDAVPIIESLAPDLMDKVRSLCFTEESDRVGWKWEPGGVYTASSIYKVMIGGSDKG